MKYWFEQYGGCPSGMIDWEEDFFLTEKEKELQEFGDELKNEESLAKTERQRLDTINKTINDKKQNIESIDSKLEKIKELYEKLNSKK